MWQVNEMVKILKEFAQKTSYDSFTQKHVAVICDVLLKSFEERHMISMLFREGIGDCLQGIPYTTKQDVSAAKERVRAFVQKYGLSDTNIENVVEFFGLLSDESASRENEEVLRILYQQRDIMQKIDEESKAWISVEEEKDFDNLNIAEVCALRIKMEYKSKSMPSLSAYRLQKFTCSIPISMKQMAELNMCEMKELSFYNADISENIVIEAPVLEKLYIYNENGYDELTPIEKMLWDHKKLIIHSNKLKELHLSHFGGYDLSCISNLQELETLVIRDMEIEDMSWISECTKLKKLVIAESVVDIGKIPSMESLQVLSLDYTQIDTIDTVNEFPQLQKLYLRGNQIKRITNPNTLRHIPYIDITRNPLENIQQIKAMNIPGLITNDAERAIANLENQMDIIFRWAYLSYRSSEKNIENASLFFKRIWLKQTESENYLWMISIEFARKFYSYNPESLWSDYDPEIKKKYLEFIKEKYPFIEIKEEYENQIRREKLGIKHFYKSVAGNVIYYNRSLYIVNVRVEDEDHGVSIDFKNAKSDLKQIQIEKMIRENCSYIDLDHEQVVITIFDLYNSGTLQGIEVGILAALHSWNRGIEVPSSTFISGEYANHGLFKKEKIFESRVPLAYKTGADRILFFSNSQVASQKIEGVWIEYRTQMDLR